MATEAPRCRWWCRGSGRALAFALLAPLGAVATASAAAPCAGVAVDRTLATGARWQLCLEERAAEGFVLGDVYFTPAGSAAARRVIDRASVAQVHIAYDDDRARHYVLSEAGLGGGNLEHLAAAECAGGTVRSSSGRPVVCERVGPRHYAYKYYTDSLQGEALELWSSAHAFGFVFVPRWTLFDDGAIEPAIGLSGELRQTGNDVQHGWPLDGAGTIGVSASITYHWRIDADLGESGGDDVVEELELPAADTGPSDTGSKHRLLRTILAVEAAHPADLATKRWWRIVDSANNPDGHPVSYHLQAIHAGYLYSGTGAEPWSGTTFAVTVDRACERLAAQNLHPCAGGGGGAGGTDLSAYVDGESLAAADPVLWHGLSFHWLPRDEDQPAIPLRFDGFAFEPRDAWATNPLAELP